MTTHELLRQRLIELQNLKDGWLDGDGRAPRAAAIGWLADALQAHFTDELPLPHLYPTPEGGVQAEWSLGPIEVSLAIDVERHLAQWHCLNSETDTEKIRALNLDDVADWNWLAEQITRNPVAAP